MYTHAAETNMETEGERSIPIACFIDKHIIISGFPAGCIYNKYNNLAQQLFVWTFSTCTGLLLLPARDGRVSQKNVHT